MSPDGNEIRPDSAARYVELAKINQDQTWKRRQSEWRTSFMMWGLFAAVPAFVYKEVDGAIDDDGRAIVSEAGGEGKFPDDLTLLHPPQPPGNRFGGGLELTPEG